MNFDPELHLSRYYFFKYSNRLWYITDADYVTKRIIRRIVVFYMSYSYKFWRMVYLLLGKMVILWFPWQPLTDWPQIEVDGDLVIQWMFSQIFVKTEEFAFPFCSCLAGITVSEHLSSRWF